MLRRLPQMAGILLAGSGLRSFYGQSATVMRLSAVGQPDNNFSDDGRLILKPNRDYGNNYAVLRMSNGNILLAGETQLPKQAPMIF